MTVHLRELPAKATARPITANLIDDGSGYVSMDDAAAIVAVMNAADALLDENDRLRAALEEIATKGEEEHVWSSTELADIARAALDGGQAVSDTVTAPRDIVRRILAWGRADNSGTCYYCKYDMYEDGETEDTHAPDCVLADLRDAVGMPIGCYEDDDGGKP